MILDRASADQVVVTPCRYGRMMHLAQDMYMGRAFTEYGEYSESEVELWRTLLQPDAIVADVGANIGAHTVALAQLVPRGIVFAFEPLRFMYNLLCGNLALNGITNVLAFNAAAGAARGQITVPAIDYTQEGNYGGVALGAVKQGNPIPVLRLDDVLPTVTLIKADVEGMEKAVLQGAQRLISRYRPVLYLENNPGPQQQDLIDYVHALSYDLWWHCAPHFNPQNFRGNQVNIYDDVVSFNMIGLPSHPGNRETMGCDPIPRIAAA